jgi:diguanylate cyclase (GGDEF)-like protein
MGTGTTLAHLPGQLEFRSDVFDGIRRQIAILFIDLDNFKSVNDRQGHLAGDKCLEGVATAICAAVLEKGRVYRYGGDEFAIVLRNFTIDEAVATAERIREAIDSSSEGKDITITASIGVATTDQILQDPESLIDAADKAMYASKHIGGNAVTRWPIPKESRQSGNRPSGHLTPPSPQREDSLIGAAMCEIVRNMGHDSTSIITERRHLNNLIAHAEQSDWETLRPRLLELLHDLRSVGEAQAKMPLRPAAIHHRNKYLPLADETKRELERALREFGNI